MAQVVYPDVVRNERDEALGSSEEENEAFLSKKELAERERLKRKNQKRKQKKKRCKEKKKELSSTSHQLPEEDSGAADLGDDEGEDSDVEIEYVPEAPELEHSDPNYYYFAKVFQAFKIGEGSDLDVKDESEGKEAAKEEEQSGPTKAAILERILQEEEEEKKEREKEAENEEPKVSKRKLRIMSRPSIAELKASCTRPDVVEWHDVTAKDPKLLVHLKSLRNTVPVPRHWCFKRKYLAGKRGFEKPPFELPDFIKRTGIMEMRQALAEKEEEKSLKTKMREKVRPKMGRIDIDYQKLHDAFFRWQTKPKMSILGDLYFEGKEFETKLREKKPGELSDDLRIALGMPVGPNATKFPPPWLIAMQRYGPPPSYPNLKVPGLNAPIPEGCSFGYHAGGWGKPPVDETGKPLYGDVFGVEVAAQPSLNDEDEIERRPWGEMESEESEEEESEEEEEEEEADKATEADDSGLVTPAEGLITPSGISSGMPTGVETPDSIELRKKKMQEEGGDTPASLYQVLPEKRVERVAGQMMGSSHVYDLSATKKDKGGQSEGGVEVSLNPEELDLQDPSGLQKKYEEGLRQQRGEKDEDFSDMVAEYAARQSRKRKIQEEKKSSSKKYKDFKF